MRSGYKPFLSTTKLRWQKDQIKDPLISPSNPSSHKEMRRPPNERSKRSELPTQPLHIYIGTWRWPKCHYTKHKTQIPLRVKPSSFLSDLRTDTPPSRLRFALTQASRWCHMPSAAAIRPYRTRPRFWGPNRQTCHRLVLRHKPVKTATSDVDACPTSRQVPRRLQDLSHSRCTGSLLELAVTFLPN
jgi:hypothetical protein